jgi:hypothetical protein
MLSERATQYREYWRSKGREPPTKDEWYEIAEAEDADAGESEGYWLEVVKDENGVPLSGDVKAWPFDGPGKYSVPLISCNDLVLTLVVPSSFLEGKIFPPEATPKLQESSKLGEQERQYNEERSKQEIEQILRGFYKSSQRAPSPAGSGQ